MKLRSIFYVLREKFRFILNDTSGTFVFNVDGHEITATFAEERNDELLPRLREILLGYPHIRHDTPSDSKIEKNIKEAV